MFRIVKGIWIELSDKVKFFIIMCFITAVITFIVGYSLLFISPDWQYASFVIYIANFISIYVFYFYFWRK